MRIGIPKETGLEERRVALAPAGVDALTRNGHTVYVQSGAGTGSHFSDDEYISVGAKIVYNADEVFQRSECIVKVSQLNEDETALLQDHHIVFSFLHLSVSKKKIVSTLLEKKVTAIGFELIEDKTGLPVLHSMSEIAGQLSVQIAEELLKSTMPEGRGVLLGGITGVAPAAVVILGAGVVGRTAARSALGRGAQVIVLDKDLNRLRLIDDTFPRKVTTVQANTLTIARGVKFADVLIGSVLIKGEKAPNLVTDEMVQTMKKGAVIIDISIDQGGCIATSRPTSLSNPTFVQHGVIHYAVPNMTASVARTASMGITNAALNYIQAVADKGLAEALQHDPGLAAGVGTYSGYCTNEVVADTFALEYRPIRILPNN